MTEKKRKKREHSRKNGKHQEVALAAREAEEVEEEGVAYSVTVRQFDLPKPTSNAKKCSSDAQEAVCSSSEDTSMILDGGCTKCRR